MKHKVGPRLLILWMAVALNWALWFRPVVAEQVGTAKKTSLVAYTALADQESAWAGAVTELYQTQLTKTQLSAYEALEGADLATGKALWYPSVRFVMEEEKARDAQLVQKEEAIVSLFADGERALYAFRLDYMDEVYWMYDCDVDVNWSVTSLGEGRAQVEVNYVAFTPLAYYGAALSERAAVEEALVKVLREVIESRKNSSRAQTVWALASYMASHYAYGNAAAKVGHTPAALLLSGYGRKASCEGYARLFQMLSKRLGIPVLYVESKTHAYNYVQLENGAWYGVDVAWADVGKNLDENWLLFGSNWSRGKDATGAHEVSLSRYGASLQAMPLSPRSYGW